jgi:pimeloyl-ACP methyl ester carboxylesterase
MCWSARRGYESAFGDCLNAVDEAITRMRNLGATQLVVGGLGLGGNAAIAYGATHPGLKGVIALAPGHDAQALAGEAEIADGIAQAEALIAQGKGDQDASFSDIGIGPGGPYMTEIRTTPAIYMSFFGPRSAAVIADNATRLSVPLLWVASSQGPPQSGAARAGFDKAPANPLNRYVVVASPDLGTPEAAKDAVVSWLRDLSRQ